jgi:uncharacterized protein YdaU (DUF1376 family)
MQLYVSDFLGDTMHLSTEQIGGYMLMLMAMWNAGGSLPNDDKKLARVCRMSAHLWKKNREEMLAFFEVTETGLTHGRVTKELGKIGRISEKNSQKGFLGGTAKALKYKTSPLAAATNHNHNHKEEDISLKDEGGSHGIPVHRKLDKELWAKCLIMSDVEITTKASTYRFPSDLVNAAWAEVLEDRAKEASK